MKLTDAKVFDTAERLYSVQCTFRHFTTTYQVTLRIGCFIIITVSLVLIITNEFSYCFNKYAKTIQRLFCC